MRKVISKKFLTKFIESCIFILSVSGILLVTSLDPTHEMLGYYLWFFGNIIAIIFLAYNKMYILSSQFCLYLILTVRAMIIRM